MLASMLRITMALYGLFHKSTLSARNPWLRLPLAADTIVLSSGEFRILYFLFFHVVIHHCWSFCSCYAAMPCCALIVLYNIFWLSYTTLPTHSLNKYLASLCFIWLKNCWGTKDWKYSLKNCWGTKDWKYSSSGSSKQASVHHKTERYY